ncbi:MAG: gliding motility-associated C-terminal domain-containing protein [Bacteroidia bacterium]
MRKATLLIVVLSLSPLLNAQPDWISKAMFQQKCFVENKGQFDKRELPSKEKVLFYSATDNVEYFFTASGYTVVKHESAVTEKMMKEEKEEALAKERSEKKEEERERSMRKKTERYHCLRFEGVNEDHAVNPDQKLPSYYSYCIPGRGKGAITALAYSKLTYVDIYPMIDLVFEFPVDSVGIKYSFVLHPGADPSLIRMNYAGEESTLSASGNIEIKSDMGTIVDHAPVSWFGDNRQPVKSSFRKEKNSIFFSLESYPGNRTVIIDPWTTVPAFSISSRAYDVDYDSNGNVYVHGEGASTASEVLKYSPAGTLIWSYATPGFFYGDFAVDRNTNNIFITEGFDPTGVGARIVKIDASANVLATFSGDPNFIEMWRISFDRCNRQAVIAGGGISTPSYQTCMLDTELVVLTPVTYILPGDPHHDVVSLALDNSGNCFQMSAKSSSDLVFNNKLTKLPLPGLSPTTWSVSTNYGFIEATSLQYFGIPGVSTGTNSYNGLTTTGNYVYSYDSYVLKKWNAASGTLLTAKPIAFPAGGDSTLIYWGGIASDDCGNLFLGHLNVVEQYDTSLVLVNSYAMPDTITDLALSNSGILYISGINFLSSLTPTGMINCAGTITTSAVNTSCDSLGAATAIVTGGTPPFTYSWNTSPPSSGTSITGLLAGTYIVNVTDGACPVHILSDTVTILNNGGYSLSTNQTNADCNSLGTASVAVSGGVGPFTYSWSPSGQTTPTIVGLSAGTYTVIVTDQNDGCMDTTSVSIAATMGPNANAGPDVTIINGTSAMLTATGGGTYLWSTGETTNTIYVSPSEQTVYCVTVTDNGGCNDTACVKVSVEHPCPGLETLQVPDAFSPNGDGKNDVFLLQGWADCTTDFQMLIYDRWGEKVFESDDVNFEWNGKFKGKTMDPAVFVYFINATVNGSEVRRKGNITLIQ